MSGRYAMRTAPRARGGFTLLELMVALTVGGLAITSIYAIGSASTRVFHQQHQLASSQTAMRLAMNQVKRDIARAGFLATPGADLAGQSCAPPTLPLHDPGGSGRLAGLSFFGNDLVTASTERSAVDPTGANAANGFTVDEVVLMGNYETASEYPGASVAFGNPAQVSVSSNWYSFHRDFTNWFTLANPPVVTQALLDRAFAPGRLIRIRMPSGLLHFATVSAGGVTAATGTTDTQIQFDPAIPAACAATATGAWIAPVSTIRYFVRNARADELPADAAETTGPMAQLIREEVRPGDKRTPLFAVVNGRGIGTRAVLDYVVGFNLAFTSTGATTLGNADAYLPGVALPQAPDNDDASPPTASEHAADTVAINANPERVRSAVIDLAVRTPEQDPTFPFANCRRMRCFQVFPATGDTARRGAARVRRLRAEVFLPNIAYEGY